MHTKSVTWKSDAGVPKPYIVHFYMYDSHVVPTSLQRPSKCLRHDLICYACIPPLLSSSLCSGSFCLLTKSQLPEALLGSAVIDWYSSRCLSGPQTASLCSLSLQATFSISLFLFQHPPFQNVADPHALEEDS